MKTIEKVYDAINKQDWAQEMIAERKAAYKAARLAALREGVEPDEDTADYFNTEREEGSRGDY